MNREQFMKFFRSDDFQDHMSADDCNEIFLGVLKGSGDLTGELLTKLAEDYSVKISVISDEDPIQENILQLFKLWEKSGVSCPEACEIGLTLFLTLIMDNAPCVHAAMNMIGHSMQNAVNNFQSDD